MIQLPEILVEISPARLANELGFPTTEISSFLDEVHGLLKPAGVFNEVDPKTGLGLKKQGQKSC
ncbi:MAG: hypothetical protein JRI54_14600 [Deltaproteobacteria bacterium]|nr:hypothetical protein [Deltaproteobacteria bacterium]